MSEANFTFLTGSLGSASVDRGVTGGQTPPNGGGTFVYGFNSLQVSTGAVALFNNQVNFAPMAKGGSVQVAMKKLPSGGTSGWSCFCYIGLQGTNVNDTAYILGIQDGDPAFISLRKGRIVDGLPEGGVDPTGSKILRRSTNSVALDTWIQLRLDMVVNLTGDVVLNMFQNDVAVNPVLSPVWSSIVGMSSFIDDSLSINTGTAPLTSGRAGFGQVSSDITRRSIFDAYGISRQL